MVVPRLAMRETVSQVVRMLTNSPSKPGGNGNGKALVPVEAE